MFRLNSRKALVTGGASGIGEAITDTLSRAGAVVIVADIDAKNGERVAQACRARATGARFVLLSVADETDCARVADEIGPIDVLVNNAGIGHVGTIERTNGADLDRLYSVNVRGVFNVTKAFIGGMLARRAGTIVNMASIGGVVGIAERVAYCTTKFAVVGLTKSLAIDYATHGIRYRGVAAVDACRRDVVHSPVDASRTCRIACVGPVGPSVAWMRKTPLSRGCRHVSWWSIEHHDVGGR